MDRIKSTFGLELQQGDQHLNVKVSFFRFWCLPYGICIYTVVCVLLTLIQLSLCLATVAQYAEDCATVDLAVNHSAPYNPYSVMDVQSRVCRNPVFFEGTFLTSFAVLIFLVLNTVNSMVYRKTDFNTASDVPTSVYLQYVLHSMLISLVFVSSAAFDMWLRPHQGRLPGYYGFTVFSSVIMACWALFGSYEMQFYQVFYSHTVLTTYIGLVSVLNGVGLQLYPMFEYSEHLLGIVGLIVFNLGLHTILVAFQKYKIHLKFTTHWRPIIHTVEPDGMDASGA